MTLMAFSCFHSVGSAKLACGMKRGDMLVESVEDSCGQLNMEKLSAHSSAFESILLFIRFRSNCVLHNCLACNGKLLFELQN